MWAHHSKVQQRLLRELQAHGRPEMDGAALEQLHGWISGILDAYVSEMVAGFEQERLNWEGGSPARRRELIEALVAGEPLPADAEQRLGMRLGGHHAAIAIETADAVPDDDRAGRMRALGPRVSARLGAAGGFVQAMDTGVLLCWTFSSAPPDDIVAQAGEAVRELEQRERMILCAGPVGRGPEGLRAAMRGALEVRDVVRHPAFRSDEGSRRVELLRHDEIAVVGLLLQDPRRLRGFVHETLGALAADSARSADVRATLLRYLLAGGSRKAAAEALHIAPNTVAYRVQKAERLLGRPAQQDPLPTLLALQAAQILPGLLPEAVDGP